MSQQPLSTATSTSSSSSSASLDGGRGPRRTPSGFAEVMEELVSTKLRLAELDHELAMKRKELLHLSKGGGGGGGGAAAVAVAGEETEEK